MKHVRYTFIAFSAFFLTGCATILTGTKDTISFNSTPQGAIIYKDGVELCKTPCSVRMKRSINDTDLEFRLDGYETRVLTLDKEFNVVSIINLGFLLGWAIDAISGSVMKYDRKVYDITLRQEKRVSELRPVRIDIDTRKKAVDVYVNASELPQ